MCTMCMISNGGKVVGLLSSSIDPVARAVDKKIYGDNVGRLIKTGRLYIFISMYISSAVI